VDELDFQIILLAVDGVFTGRVEDDLLQDILDSLVDEGVAISFADGGSKVVSCVKQPKVFHSSVPDVEEAVLTTISVDRGSNVEGRLLQP